MATRRDGGGEKVVVTEHYRGSGDSDLSATMNEEGKGLSRAATSPSVSRRNLGAPKLSSYNSSFNLFSSRRGVHESVESNPIHEVDDEWDEEKNSEGMRPGKIMEEMLKIRGVVEGEVVPVDGGRGRKSEDGSAAATRLPKPGTKSASNVLATELTPLGHSKHREKGNDDEAIGRYYVRMPELKKVRKHPEWSLNYDKVSGCDYYFNYKTGESSWEMPKGYMEEKTGPPENTRLQMEGLYHRILRKTEGLKPPGLVIGVFSELNGNSNGKDLDLVPKFEKRFTDAMVEICSLTQAWIVGNGGSNGLNATIGMMKEDHKDKLRHIPSIQIVPAANFKGNIALRGGSSEYPIITDHVLESHLRSQSQTLDLNHSHFVLVDKLDPREFEGDWNPVMDGVQNSIDPSTGRPIDTRGCEEDMTDLFIECVCGGGRLNKEAVIPLVLIFYGGGSDVLAKCANTAAHGSGRSLFFIKWSGGCSDMLALFFDAYKHRPSSARASISTRRHSDASAARSIHEAHYDKLMTQAEDELKRLVGIAPDKDEDDMDPTEHEKYETALEHVKSLVRLHSEGNVHIQFLDFLNCDDKPVAMIMSNLVKDHSILPEYKTMLATRWASSKALQEILEDRPLDRNVFKLHEQQKRSGAGVGVDDNDDELLAFAALNDDATSAAVLYDFGFCNRVLDVAIRAELQEILNHDIDHDESLLGGAVRRLGHSSKKGTDEDEVVHTITWKQVYKYLVPNGVHKLQIDEYLHSKAVKLAPVLPFPFDQRVNETLQLLGKGMLETTRQAFSKHYEFRKRELGIAAKSADLERSAKQRQSSRRMSRSSFAFSRNFDDDTTEAQFNPEHVLTHVHRVWWALITNRSHMAGVLLDNCSLVEAGGLLLKSGYVLEAKGNPSYLKTMNLFAKQVSDRLDELIADKGPDDLLDTLLADATGHSRSPGKVPLVGAQKAPESNVMELFLLTFVVSKHPDMLIPFIDKVSGVEYESMCAAEFLASITRAPAQVMESPTMEMIIKVLWERHINRIFYIDLTILFCNYAAFVLVIESYLRIYQNERTQAQAETVFWISSFINCALTVYGIVKEIRTLVRKKSLWKHFKNPWSQIDLFQILTLLSSIAVLMVMVLEEDQRPFEVAHHITQDLVVAAMLFFTLKCIGYLRGFESTGWLVTVLIQNIFDVQGFLVLIVLFLFGFAIALRALWGFEYENTDDDTYDDDEKTREYLFHGPFDSFVHVVNMAVYGEVYFLDTSSNKIASEITWMILVFLISVVSLNALIALLSDSYAQIQESATANKRLARCELIADYLNILPRGWRKKSERAAAVEVLERTNLQKIIFLRATGQTSLQASAWEGQVNAIRKQTADMINKAEKRMTSLLKDILEEVKVEEENVSTLIRAGISTGPT